MSRLLGLQLNNKVLTRNIATCIFLTLLVIFSLVVGTAGAKSVIPQPGPNFYVLDEANVISPKTEAMIVNTSEELNSKTKAQVAVVTLKSLNNQPLEDVSLEILRQWKLGDKKLNNGLLILVVPSEHLSRIEVGYGLEGALPDAKTGRIQDENMIPAFKEGNYDLGLSKGYKAVVSEVAKEYNVKINIQNDTPIPVQTNDNTPVWLKILGIIGLFFLLWIDYRFFNGFFLGFLLGTLFRGGGGFGGGRGGDSGGGGSGGGGGSSRGW
jgi:uncharacterized protein